ncbi:MAG: hypothetical protein J6Q10_00430 [Clostridia bacterium]|nr:hypothetical protein [Clostridia bacterium]
MLIKAYPVLLPITAVCIIISSITASIPAIFQQQVLAEIGVWVGTGDWKSASAIIIPKVAILAGLYAFSMIAILCYTQLMAFITQGFLNKMRLEMFSKMQNLPIRYFDTNRHGNIMSRYTNDIDALRQLISQSLPTIL